MAESAARKTSRDKVRAHRARMRAQGMKLVQIWVPDTNSPEFRKEARRQSRVIAESLQDADDQAFLDSVSILNELDD